MKKLLWLVASAALVALVAACSSGTPSATTTTPAPSGGNSVSISNFAFSPSNLTVTIGTTVTWTNKDSVAHTVTGANGAFNSGTMAPGATFSQAFNTAGVYNYSCSVHPYMTGTVTVQ